MFWWLTEMRKRKNEGFTLLELLVTIAILSILAAIGFGQYRTSQIKARDAQRKADLGNIARALEMYYNDYESYPLSDGGRISVDGVGLDWGTEFSTTEAIYMKALPKDPQDPDHCYCYESDGSYYVIYAYLENENDPDYQPGYQCASPCSDSDYSYFISSSNFQPTPGP